MKIQCARLDWQSTSDGLDIPISRDFGDVYFSKENGLLETRHVFLNGNDLPQRLAQLNNHQYFCVGETGFGTGLNILALWQLWQNVRPNNHSHLHVISFEKFPLHRDDLRRALAVWTELKELSTLLLDYYPDPIAGCHRLSFPNERFSLDLWLGDAIDHLPQVYTKHPVDAWFLDGFAPACNPDFWQEHILNHIIRLSDVGTTFASFTVAGVVKRGLAQYPNIQITRPKGFGRKREMLKAIWQPTEQQTTSNRPLVKKTQHIAIVGAGIAGLTCAYRLAELGHMVTLFDHTSALAGASGNPLALINPKLSAIEHTADHLMTMSWQYALRYYAQFDGFRRLNAHQLQLKAEKSQLGLQHDYPEGILSIKQEDVYYPELILHHAGAVQPKRIAQQILQHENIQLNLHHIHRLEHHHLNQVKLYEHDQCLGSFDQVILCNAAASHALINSFIPTAPKLKSIRGQVSWCDAQILEPQHAYSYGGYCMQLDPKHFILGASFYANREDCDVLLEDHQHNFDLLQHTLPYIAQQLPPLYQWQGRASIRAQTADYFPIVGQLTHHIFACIGLGSKGFLFAPLCAELVASQILGQCFPVPQSLYYKLSPQRFKAFRN